MACSLLNLSKSGLTVTESRKSSNKMLKFKKSVTTASRKSNSNTKTQERLVGGADAPAEVEDASLTKIVTNETEVMEETVSTSTSKLETEKVTFPTSGPCCTCLLGEPGSTGDKKVDEMIDYVHQNLQEAGKALATLSENFEHDSKLMFVDILGRIQQWTGIVQNKLDLCKADIEALRQELMARACEIANLKKQLAECEEIVAQTADQGVQQDGMGGEDYQTNTDITEGDQKDALEIVCKDAAIQSILKDRERMRREIEMEAEIARLRKENERIIKERAEYENAIQRALLRGVSCLNVEALRVLRCPPIPCCSPCATCPATAMKPIVPCRNDSGPPVPKGCVTQQRTNSGKSTSCTVKRPCASPCCSAGKSRKSISSSSMIFLLHQDDAKSICNSKNIKVPPVCGSPVMKKIEIPPCPRFT